MSIVLRLIPLAAIATLLSISAALAASIGSISAFNGNSEIVRKAEKFPTQSRLPIEQLDNVQTGNGRVEITFVDNSNVKITEHSKLVIDDFVYDGNPNTSKMALKFASGTIRFATGQLGAINKQNISLATPSATIAVRGTDFAATVDDFGKSLVILLPEADGSVGEITVSNAGGSVVLTRAFEATLVNTFDNAPSAPVILNLDLNMIDNTLIVSPPDEIRYSDEGISSKSNILDLSELNIDYLKNDDLEKDNLQTTELDVDPLNANFLEDFLDSTIGGTGTKDGVKLGGTAFGYDPSTQIYSIIAGEKLTFTRSVAATVNVTVDKDKGKNLFLDTGGKQYNIELNEGGTNIHIKQSN